MVHLAHHQHYVEEAHDQIHPREPYEREEHATRGDEGRYTFRGAEEPVGEPGLAAELGREPSCCVGDKREGYGEHQDPEHPTRSVKAAPPKQEGRHHHDGYEDGSQADHDMVAVVEERDVIRPVLLGEGLEALHLGVPVLVDQ